MPAPTVPHRAVEPAKITPTPPAPAQRILAAGSSFMCPGGNPTDRREFSRVSSAAIRDARRALPAYTENQPKSAHLSPRRGYFRRLDFELRCFYNGIRYTNPEFTLAPTLGRCFNLKFRWKNNVIYFAKRKYTPHFRQRSFKQRHAPAGMPNYVRSRFGQPLLPSRQRKYVFPRAVKPHTSEPRTAQTERSAFAAARRMPAQTVPEQITPNTVTAHTPVRSGTHSSAPEKEKCLTEADTIPYRIEFTRARSCRNEGSGSKRLRSCEFR